MKILNLYAGIGGNRKYWDGHNITAVEIREDIAAVYNAYFPNDKIIIGDAHAYLLKHHMDYDFIWTSPPCQSHSRARFYAYKNNDQVPDIYPDMSLYQEIIFLRTHCKGLWTVENVDPYYPELIPASVKLGRHLFWANFGIAKIETVDADLNQLGTFGLQNFHGFDLTGFNLISRKDDLLRNCVASGTGRHILDCAVGKYKSKSSQITIF